MEAKYIVIGKQKHTTRTFKDVMGLVAFMQGREARDYLICTLTDFSVVTIPAEAGEKRQS